MKDFGISDQFWMKVIQLVQLSMLTGTDIIDYFRQVRVTEGEDGNLNVTKEYEEQYARTIEQLMERIVQLQAEAEGVDLTGARNLDGGEGEIKFGIMDPLNPDETPDQFILSLTKKDDEKPN